MNLSVSIPQSWHDVTLRQLQLLESGDTVSVLTGMHPEVIRLFDGDDMAEIHNHLSFVSSDIPTDIREVVITDNTESVIFVPPAEDYLTVAEYVDGTSYDGKIANMHTIMPVLWRPLSHTTPDGQRIPVPYDAAVGNGMVEYLRDRLTAPQAMSAVSFFLQSWADYVRAIRTSSPPQDTHPGSDRSGVGAT